MLGIRPVAVLARRARSLGAPAGAFRRTGFTPARWEALHPKPPGVAVYHDARHSENTRRVMEQLARTWFPGQETFLGEVAGLHDIDPDRTPGTPARVQATLAWLDANAADVKARYGWAERHLAMAKVLIMRTEFPLGCQPRALSFNDVYRFKSPRQVYKEMLAALPGPRMAFALQAGAMLSEYADKASWYLEAPEAAFAATRGLANELDASGGDAKAFDTGLFLRGLGRRESFALDDALAVELGLVGLRLPLLDAVLGSLDAVQRRNFHDNVARFARPDGQPDAAGH